MGCILQASLKGMEHSWDEGLYRGKERQKYNTHTHTHKHTVAKSQGLSHVNRKWPPVLPEPTDGFRRFRDIRPADVPSRVPSSATEVCGVSAASWRHCSPPSTTKHVCHYMSVGVCVHVTDSDASTITHTHARTFTVR